MEQRKGREANQRRTEYRVGPYSWHGPTATREEALRAHETLQAIHMAYLRGNHTEAIEVLSRTHEPEYPYDTDEEQGPNKQATVEGAGAAKAAASKAPALRHNPPQEERERLMADQRSARIHLEEEEQGHVQTAKEASRGAKGATPKQQQDATERWLLHFERQERAWGSKGQGAHQIDEESGTEGSPGSVGFDTDQEQQRSRQEQGRRMTSEPEPDPKDTQPSAAAARAAARAAQAAQGPRDERCLS